MEFSHGIADGMLVGILLLGVAAGAAVFVWAVLHIIV